MEANQLMIGNYLSDGKEVFKVEKAFFTLLELNMQFCKPIPLTEEWLLKFGFVKDSDGVESIFSYKDFRYELYKPDEDKTVWLFCDQGEVLIDIKFIHTLQNIWKLLTNEELILKQL